MKRKGDSRAGGGKFDLTCFVYLEPFCVTLDFKTIH